MMPIILADFQANNTDSIQVFITCAIMAQIGATFAVYFKSKNPEFKGVALSSGVTGIFGITEPAIYGVTLRLKKPLICGCTASAIGSLVTTFFASQYTVYAGLPGPLTMVNAINPAVPSSFIGMIVGGVIALAGAFVLTYFVGFDDPAYEAETTPAASTAPTASSVPAASTITVYAPMNGEIKLASEVNDPTFAEGILGEGAAIIPGEGRLYAPFDCTIFGVADTKHAINLEADGIELLIHIGLDTVELGGKCYHPKVKDGDTVKAGDLLIEFDLEEIKKKYDTITPILITNAEDFAGVEQIKTAGSVKVGEPILTVKR